MHRRTFLATATAVLGSQVANSARASTERFEPLGEVELAGTMDAVVSADGETAYVAVGDGFATVDIRNPAAPTVLAERRNLLAADPVGPLEDVWDVKLDGDRLAVAGPAHGGDDHISGVLFFDVSDPTAPEKEAFYDTDYPIHNLAFDDGVAYLTGNDGAGNPLVAVEFDAGAPEEVGRWSLRDADDGWNDVNAALRTLHDVTVQDGTAYLAHWDGGTWIVDVSDPTSMSAVGRVRGLSIETLASIPRSELGEEYGQLPGNDHYVTVDEDASLLAVGSEAWDDDPSDDHVGGPGGIELYDISTPTDPTQMASIAAPATPDATGSGVWTTAHNFDLTDGRLYAAWYRGGLTVHDVSEPATPVELAAWEDRDRASFFTAKVAEQCVIASSIDDRQAATTEGLFTFPIPDGKIDHSETTTTEPPASRTESPPTTTTEPPATTTRTQSGTITADTNASNRTADPTDEQSPPAGGFGPGLGPLSAVMGLAAGSWYVLQNRRESD